MYYVYLTRARKLKLISILVILASIVLAGCSSTHSAEIKILSLLDEKYDEEFVIESIEKDMLLPIGGTYYADVYSTTDPDYIFQVEYNGGDTIKDTYQDDSASATMTLNDREKLDKIFDEYALEYYNQSFVDLNTYDYKIDTSNIEEIKKAVDETSCCWIAHHMYFVVYSQEQVDMLKSIFEENIEYFDEEVYTIGFCYWRNVDNTPSLSSYYGWTYDSTLENAFVGYYQIYDGIDSLEDLQNSYYEGIFDFISN